MKLALFALLTHLKQMGIIGTVLYVVSVITHTILPTAFHWVEKWLFDDFDSLNWIVPLIIIDAITGGVKHYKKGTFDVGELIAKLALNKVFVITVYIFVLNLANQAAALEGFDVPYTNILSISGVFAYLLASILLDNVYEITDHKFPPAALVNVLKKLK